MRDNPDELRYELLVDDDVVGEIRSPAGCTSSPSARSCVGTSAATPTTGISSFGTRRCPADPHAGGRARAEARVRERCDRGPVGAAAVHSRAQLRARAAEGVRSRGTAVGCRRCGRRRRDRGHDRDLPDRRAPLPPSRRRAAGAAAGGNDDRAASERPTLRPRPRPHRRPERRADPGRHTAGAVSLRSVGEQAVLRRQPSADRLHSRLGRLTVAAGAAGAAHHISLAVFCR